MVGIVFFRFLNFCFIVHASEYIYGAREAGRRIKYGLWNDEAIKAEMA